MEGAGKRQRTAKKLQDGFIDTEEAVNATKIASRGHQRLRAGKRSTAAAAVDTGNDGGESSDHSLPSMDTAEFDADDAVDGGSGAAEGRENRLQQLAAGLAA